MKKWEYTHVVYRRDNKPMEPCIYYGGANMDDIPGEAALHVSSFLSAAGQRGWELAGTLLPFAPGKVLAEEAEGESDRDYVVRDALDIQWMIFKREF
jgi:hypothetical protein